MAGRQRAVHAGLLFTTTPAYWLRRVTHFPFFFESHNPSFRVRITRLVEGTNNETWLNNKITVDIVFADASVTSREWPVPDLQIGDHQDFTLDHIFTAYPGRTIIRIPNGPDHWKTLYAYDVRREESIWLGAWAAFIALAALIIAVAGIVGVAR